MKTKIIIITSQFPYGTGETFLETEIEYWSRQKNIDIFILPIQTNNIKRKIPKNIFLNHILSNKKLKRKDKIKALFKLTLSLEFYNEFFSEIIKKPRILPDSLAFYAKKIMYMDILKKYIMKNQNSKLIFYTYWFNEVTSSLQSLKNYSNLELLTRVHGYDLYQERRKNNYIPFRKQLIHNIDKIYTITDTAKLYLRNNFGFKQDILITSRLGVEDYNIITKISDINSFHLVSCSYLVKIKNIYKIIDALNQLSNIRKDINIKWTHIGSGSLETELKLYANNKLQTKQNVSYSFLGTLKNKDIYQFYKTNKIDVFINVSESEGVPVSIMEAMSCHIPIVAPNIGGIKDMLIDGYNGSLLKENSQIADIVKALKYIDFFKNQKIRNNSYRLFKKKYDASINYISFIERIIK